MKTIIQTKWFKCLTYLLLVAATFLIGFIILNCNTTFKNVIVSFYRVAEDRSFDYRQTIKIMHKQILTPSKDIVILAIDDASLERLWDKYGEWPVPRNVYSDIIKHIEQSNPKAIVFDLLFIKSLKSTQDADNALISTVNNYNNIYFAMNFDSQSELVRKSTDLPKKLSVNLQNNSDVDIKAKYSFSNCRTILSGLIESNAHIGITNVIRSDDGIIRKIAPIMYYKNNYYPYLTFKVGNDIISNNNNDFLIDKKRNLIINDTKFPINKQGELILNWYGTKGTHQIYPLYKVIDEIEQNKHSLNFNNKIILIGTTAMSLQDTKSVPVQDEVYPGVEVHATFLNNMLDKNFIKQTNKSTNLVIYLCLVVSVGLIIMLSTSTFVSILSSILFTLAYLGVSYYVMEIYNLWIPVVMPVILIVLSFILSFLAKYLIKSKDFEYQYKLATIDGLTELYNHRYFQDSLRNQIDIAERYKQNFSLIILDIDFFKKFNDTYGHQAGDAVLRQVADTLKKNSRSTDIVCRYGGEEMSIILPNTNKEEALNNAKRILEAISEKEFDVNSSTKKHVTVSIGVSTYPQNGIDAETIIESADKGLYYAKNHGRNQVGIIE